MVGQSGGVVMAKDSTRRRLDEKSNESAKWQAVAAKQKAEIKRLIRELAAVRDDLADIKAQRDRYADLIKQASRR